MPSAGAACCDSTSSRIFRQAEWNVHYCFQLYRSSLLCSGTEFPLAQRSYGIGVELRIDSAHELNAVDRTVAANDGIKDDFAGDALAYQRWRILGIHLLHRHGARYFRGRRRVMHAVHIVLQL